MNINITNLVCYLERQHGITFMADTQYPVTFYAAKYTDKLRRLVVRYDGYKAWTNSAEFYTAETLRDFIIESLEPRCPTLTPTGRAAVVKNGAVRNTSL